MNADRLLEVYDQISEAPDAISRLRRFVLDLAMRGKLVQQNKNDDTASELLAEIAAKKARSERVRKNRKPRNEADLSADNPYELPENWTWVSFGELHHLVRGVTYSKSDVSDTASAGFVPVLRANNIGPTLTDDDPVHVKSARVRCDQYLRRGDYMIALSSGSKNLVGKAALVPNDLDKAFGGFCGAIRLLDPSLVGFVGVFLSSQLYRESISAGSRGIGINNLKKEALANLHFPLPPLAEQHRIVAKVDELMALCDRLEEARKTREKTRDKLTAASLARLTAPDTTPEDFPAHANFAVEALPALTTRPDQIKTLRQTILNLAVRGKLVEQDPADKPASELLEAIETERLELIRAGKIKKSKPLPPVDLSLAPYELPLGWAWARFPELGTFGRGKSKHRPRNDPVLYRDGTIPFIQTGDVARSGGRITSHAGFYNEVGLAQSKLWPRGTMCITIAANIADSGILDFDACFPDSVVGLVPASMFDSARYFEYFIRTAKANLLEFAPATAQKNINLGILETVLIPLPPLAEQHRIVAKVDALMALCDRLEAALTTTDTTRTRFLEALLHEALEPSQDVMEAAE